MIRSNLLRPAAIAVLTLAISAAASAAEADAGASGSKVYASRCAVCHGPEALGIPGSFPSLREQIALFAKSVEGRDYMVMVVTTGLMGELKVSGVSYRGVMPAQSGLSETEVAAVLSYLVADRGKDVAAAPLTAADVAQARARHADPSPQNTRTLRPIQPE